MKHLISLSALLLSAAACSSDPADGGTAGSGGTSSSTGGLANAGGAGAKPTTGGIGPAPTAGTSNNGGAGGQGPTGGSPSAGGGGSSSGGVSTAGAPAGGSGGGGGTPNNGGAGPGASFKCENLSLAPAATGMAQPSGAAGGLKVLDWAGFKGAASFTFDDNTPSQLDNYAALKATGGHVTWFLIASSASASGYKPTMADGQEIANHTQTHPGSASQNEVTQAQTTLMTNFGVAPHSLAAPNCQDAWANYAKGALFQNRGPCGKPVATVAPRDNTDPFKLPAWLPDEGDAASVYTGAITAGNWRIFVIHGFDSRNGTYKPVPIANVTAAMSKAVMDGFWVEGMTNVGAYWQGQKLIPASATTSATWTLPANFPKNTCVRITTSGGTVTQKGETIPWDSHGYYQISLDAGEVTIK
jgi:hypothetical protein